MRKMSGGRHSWQRAAARYYDVLCSVLPIGSRLHKWTQAGRPAEGDLVQLGTPKVRVCGSVTSH